MKYQYMSSKVIIDDFRRDALPQNSGWIYDSIEWIYNTIKDIGCGLSMVVAKKTIQVTNGRCKIPCDSQAIKKIIYNNTVLDKLAVVNTDELDLSDNPFYTLIGNQPNYIFFSFITGEIDLYYYSMAVEETNEANYPYVPDEENIRQALFWRIMYQYLLRGGKHQTIKDWKEAKMLYDQYVIKARAEVKMPSSESMEELSNSLVDLNHDYEKSQKQLYLSPIINKGGFTIDKTITYNNGDISVISNEYIPDKIYVRQ